jgi:hypothetical protein
VPAAPPKIVDLLDTLPSCAASWISTQVLLIGRQYTTRHVTSHVLRSGNQNLAGARMFGELRT